VNWKTAVIENLDKNIGRLLDDLDASGLAENTLVIFTTDNGSPGLYRGGKSSHYDGGHRVPCFIRWPAGGLGGEVRSGEIDTLTAHIDWLPTLMELLDLEDVADRPPEVPVHGLSFASLLVADPANDDPALRRRYVAVDNQRVPELTKYKNACVMRDEVDADGNIIYKWRLTRNKAGAPYQLYDVLTDPKQRKNLAGDQKLAPIRKQLAADYEEWWRLVSARADEFVRPVLGHPAEPDACLWGFDWHGDMGPWNQRLVAAGAKANGWWPIRLARAGRYRFELRRWPKEIEAETTLTSSYDKPVETGVLGKALPIAKARIRLFRGNTTVAEKTSDPAPGADGAVFEFEDLPEGPCSLQTWFHDKDGNELAGAYYVYVTRMQP
jgi:hypothetical protein